MPRPASWTIADLLDFEVLLSADAARDDAAVRERDRAIFVGQIQPAIKPAGGAGAGAAIERRRIFRLWLEVRRQAERESLPGGRFEAGRQALLSAAALAGLAVGASVSAALLHY
ncbi:MAG: hypothetical protein ABR587_05780, partial [Candidatus Binatia bacterium]